MPLGLAEGVLDLGVDAGGRALVGSPRAGHLQLIEIPVDRERVLAQPRIGCLREGQGDLPRLPLDVRILPRDRLGILPASARPSTPISADTGARIFPATYGSARVANSG